MRRPPPVNIATIVFAGALIVATTLVVILVRNPATHANLEDPGNYTRTPLAYVDGDYSYLGYGVGGETEAGADSHTAGRLLFVRAGCVGCHGTMAQGATVGTPLWELDEFDFFTDVREGPIGMPTYLDDVLTDDEVGLIFTFLETAPLDAAAVGITTTTTTIPPPPTTTTPPTTTSTTTAPGDTTPDNGGTATTTTAPVGPVAREIEAPTAAITVDGDSADWEAIPGLDLTLEAIVDRDSPPLESTVKIAHDESYVYVLFSVIDDFNWSTVDPHFAGSAAVMWAIEQQAGPHMGGDDPTGLPALGMVDMWTWRLECPIGVEQGGAIHGPGTDDPGNDDTCNLDDEWASEPETAQDDLGEGAENSLLGVFSHTNPIENGDGTWYFEIRRPLQTGDPRDAQFTMGQPALLALAYWDPDAGDDGLWGRKDHVQSSDLGWIRVVLTD